MSGILGEAPVLHHGHGLHGGLDPHLRQPHQPGRMPAACQGRGGQRKQEQASLSRKQPGARRARPCQRGCSCRNLRSGPARATEAAGPSPGTDVIPLQGGGPWDRHAQPSEDPEPEHRPLHGRHVGAGDPTAGQVPGRTHRVHVEPEDVGGQADSVSEELAQEDSGFQLEPASEQGAEQPDRELRQPLPGEGLSVPGLELHPGHRPGGRQGGGAAAGAAVQDGLQQRLRPGVHFRVGRCHQMKKRHRM
ncbi:uncharacterized protein [Bos taurus]|uniref:uncharacterized protein isoform X2 n=1 Tax=Bos taurus TaxID=9913 RepID=UPI0028CBB71F|nr:uncharacterized protein LOC132344952 isoform X2 [Bos taurus]